MKNKLLIGGSAVAVVVLVLASFNPVVGFNSVESTAKDSPLFSVRINRAIDRESKDLTYNYVGKGEATEIYLPERNDRIESVDNLINLITRMDDKSLQKLAYLIMYYLHNNEDTQEFDYKEILQSLKQLKDNPDIVNQYMTEESKVLTNICNTIVPTTPCLSLLQCLTVWLYMFGLALIVVPLLYVYLFLTLLFRCNTHNI